VGRKVKKRRTSAKVNRKPSLKTIFSKLETILDVSEEKFLKKRAKDTNRLKWGRLMVGAIDSYGKLYQIVELEDLEKRISSLEKAASQQS
jgi:hypothetical protein